MSDPQPDPGSIPPEPIRVVLVDDHALVRAGYRRLLAHEPDIRVVADCETADQAQALLEHHRGDLDVLLLDLSMPGRSGFDLLQRVVRQWPGVAVVVCTMHDSPTMVRRALDLGARGFLTKSCDPEILVQALRRVADGALVLSPDVEPLNTQPVGEAPHARLSPREFQVLLMLARGDTVESIALALGLSTKRVANLQTQVRSRLGLSSPAELVHYAMAHGLLSGSPEVRPR